MRPLENVKLTLSGFGPAIEYAAVLLNSLGVEVNRLSGAYYDPYQAWADSGLMALTGQPAGPPVMSSVPLPSCAQGVLLALNAISQRTVFEPLAAGHLLTERAAINQLQRNGSVAPGGSCRLLKTADDWLAVNLPRDYDWEMMPAWLEKEFPPTFFALEHRVKAWQVLGHILLSYPSAWLLERARLLGLAVSRSSPEATEKAAADGANKWCTIHSYSQKTERFSCDPKKSPVVFDLSSLWAGPLCGHLLKQLGARVIKVESSTRPDGARQGAAEFFDLMNSGKESVVLPLHTHRGQAQLKALLAQGDIVLESSRPRALAQMGIHAQQMVAQKPGQIWLRITGYGQQEPNARWIAFGDDAGVSAGLSELFYRRGDGMIFCGDAIADPLTGMHAALAVSAFWHAHQGCLLDISLQGVVKHCIDMSAPIEPLTARPISTNSTGWELSLKRESLEVKPPVKFRTATSAASLGAHTRRVLEEFSMHTNNSHSFCASNCGF